LESIDILDSVASSIRLDIFNNEVVRVLPCLDEFVNEEWITNKARFVYDSFFVLRSNFPKILVFDFLVDLS